MSDHGGYICGRLSGIPCDTCEREEYEETDSLRAQLAAVTAERDKALAAARELRHRCMEFDHEYDSRGKDELMAETAWIDAGEGKP